MARDGIQTLALLLPEDGTQLLRPAIVLLDITMPRMGVAWEVLARLRADPATRSLAVIVLTTATMTGTGPSCSLGANS